MEQSVITVTIVLGTLLAVGLFINVVQFVSRPWVLVLLFGVLGWFLFASTL